MREIAAMPTDAEIIGSDRNSHQPFKAQGIQETFVITAGEANQTPHAGKKQDNFIVFGKHQEEQGWDIYIL